MNQETRAADVPIHSSELARARSRESFEDPLKLVSRALTKLHSLWLEWTYPFASVGYDFSVHHSCDIRRAIAGYIRIGNDVLVGPDGRVDVPKIPDRGDPVIVIDDCCTIGPRVTILAINKIHVERDVIFGPSVLLMDHDHEFEDFTVPIGRQGTTQGGTIRIEQGCWIGFGAAIVSSRGELVIGRNSVVGANAVVTRSVPACSVVIGNPARIVKRFDPSKGEWVFGHVGNADKL